MPASYLQIVQLENGDFVLQRSTSEGVEDASGSLVTISFSNEARAFLKENAAVVARSMISAGLEVVGEISQEDTFTDEEMGDATIH